MYLSHPLLCFRHISRQLEQSLLSCDINSSLEMQHSCFKPWFNLMGCKTCHVCQNFLGT